MGCPLPTSFFCFTEPCFCLPTPAAVRNAHIVVDVSQAVDVSALNFPSEYSPGADGMAKYESLLIDTGTGLSHFPGQMPWRKANNHGWPARWRNCSFLHHTRASGERNAAARAPLSQGSTRVPSARVRRRNEVGRPLQTRTRPRRGSRPPSGRGRGRRPSWTTKTTRAWVGRAC